MRSTLGALLVLAALAPLPAAQVPRPAPEFVIYLTSGPELLLSRFRGKVVALEFLQTTCPHCQHSAQIMSRWYQELGPKGFQPLGVAFNDMAPMLVPDFIKENRVNFPVGHSQREPVYDFLLHSPVLRLLVPQMVLIDRKGVIRAQSAPEGNDNFFEEKSLRARIEALLQEPAASKSKKK